MYVSKLVIEKNLFRSCVKCNISVCVGVIFVLEYLEKEEVVWVIVRFVSLYYLVFKCFLIIYVFDFFFFYEDYFVVEGG